MSTQSTAVVIVTSLSSPPEQSARCVVRNPCPRCCWRRRAPSWSRCPPVCRPEEPPHSLLCCKPDRFGPGSGQRPAARSQRSDPQGAAARLIWIRSAGRSSGGKERRSAAVWLRSHRGQLLLLRPPPPHMYYTDNTQSVLLLSGRTVLSDTGRTVRYQRSSSPD